ncbi:B-cell linker protein [Plakobranchus ocellatus]|uniref:B-cell linker protein n=1 Tax=Plakobranchus ocellatus TaxID=259542 RepID=A0AAV3YE68_9GAST|nr:B-cell linker protein [Plakobranchus ocellatus]
MTGQRFNEFIGTVRRLYHPLNACFVIDNAPAHRQAVNLPLPQNFSVCYLPPYSPFLNICENAFALWKGNIKDSLAEVRDQLLREDHQQRMSTLGQLAEQGTAVGKSTFYVEADLDEEICSDCESDDSGTGDDYEEVDFVPEVRPPTPRKPHKSKVEIDGNNTGPDSSNSNKGTPPGPPGKPPKPSTLPKPQLNQKAFSSPSKQAKKVAVAVPSNKPTFLNKPMAKVLPQPQKPSPDNPSALPRALPFKHPTQDNRSENSCPSSTSPDSGGSVQSAFVAELSNFISSSSKHLERLQVTVEDQQSTDSSLYVDGSSVREHPLSCHPWFHEDANRTMGDARVMQIRQEGAFLVRPSSKEHPYTLVVFSDKKVCNLPINLRTDGQYALGSEESEEKRFESVAALIKYHLHSKINLSHGDHVQLSKHAQRQ